MSPSRRRSGLSSSWPLIAAATALSLAAGAVGAVAYAELSDKPGACDAQRLAVKAQPSMVSLLTSDNTPFANGIIIQADGVVLAPTSPASAPGGSQLVRLPNGETVTATIAGTDPLYGLEVLRLDRSNLPALLLSWNNELAIGDPVAVFGSGLNNSATVAASTVSAVNLTIDTTTLDGPPASRSDVIGFDTGFSDGLTGGAVLNCDGQLIGVAMAAPTTDDPASAHRPSFALAATMARRISQEILAGKPATHPWIGAAVSAVSQDVAAQYHSAAGMLITALDPTGPAATAGLAEGDVITAIDGQPANSLTWSRWLLTTDPGAQVKLEYRRGSQTNTATVGVIDQPAQASIR